MFCGQTPVAPLGYLNRASYRGITLLDGNKPLDSATTGEHSIGLGKMKYMEREHGEVAISVMQAIKHAIDGDNTMNPDKIFPYGDYPEFAGQVRDTGRGGCGCEESVTLDKTDL